MSTRDELINVLDVYQTDVHIWAVRNFGDNEGLGAYGPMMGIVEEVGELHHARLKALQRIREGARANTSMLEEEVDALGDILVYMMDYCARRGLSLAQCFLTTWEKVRERDWKNDPETGGTNEET